MTVLAIDTAAPVIGAAVLHEDRIVTRTARAPRAAERELVPWIADLCAEAGVEVRDLTGVAVAVGPGHKAVTLMPCARTSSCRASEKLRTNALVAE